MNELCSRLLDLPAAGITYARRSTPCTSSSSRDDVRGDFRLPARRSISSSATGGASHGRDHAARGDVRCRRRSSSSASLLALFLVFWVVGAIQYDRMMTPPPDAMPVYVTAKQWMWKFAYPDGRVVDGRPDRPRRTPGQARDDVARRHPQLLRPRLSHEAGRRPRSLLHGLVPGDRQPAPTPSTAPSTAASTTRGCSARSRVLSARRLRARGSRRATPRPTDDRPRRARSRRGRAARHASTATRSTASPTSARPGRALRVARCRSRADARVVADEAYLTRSMMDPRPTSSPATSRSCRPTAASSRSPRSPRSSSSSSRSQRRRRRPERHPAHGRRRRLRPTPGAAAMTTIDAGLAPVAGALASAARDLPQRRPHGAVVGCSRPTTSASASCIS